MPWQTPRCHRLSVGDRPCPRTRRGRLRRIGAAAAADRATVASSDDTELADDLDKADWPARRVGFHLARIGQLPHHNRPDRHRSATVRGARAQRYRYCSPCVKRSYGAQFRSPSRKFGQHRSGIAKRNCERNIDVALGARQYSPTAQHAGAAAPGDTAKSSTMSCNGVRRARISERENVALAALADPRSHFLISMTLDLVRPTGRSTVKRLFLSSEFFSR